MTAFETTAAAGAPGASAPDALERFATLAERVPSSDYNYEHFWTKYLLRDARRTLTGSGIKPGEMAPDFELPRADGGRQRLSALRGAPVVLHFGSYS